MRQWSVLSEQFRYYQTTFSSPLWRSQLQSNSFEAFQSGEAIDSYSVEKLNSWKLLYLVAIFSCVIIIVNPHKKKKPSTIQRSTSVQRPSTLHWSSTVPYIADAILFFGRHKQVNQHQPFRIAESIRSVLLRPATFLKTSTMPSTVLKLTNSSDIMY